MNALHLSDEQFSDLLAGETADHATAAHLTTCATCRQELSSMRSAVGDLRELSMRWAEERAPRITVPSRWTLGWQAVPGWSTAAMVLLFGIAIGGHVQSPFQPTSTAVNQTQTVTAPTEDELAQDNRLLRSIDQELSEQVRPQVPASELTAPSDEIARATPSEVAN
jgi:hypothetical protein